MSKPNTLNESDRAEIRSMFAAGKTWKYIERKTGRSKSSIASVRREMLTANANLDADIKKANGNGHTEQNAERWQVVSIYEALTKSGFKAISAADILRLYDNGVRVVGPF